MKTFFELTKFIITSSLFYMAYCLLYLNFCDSDLPKDFLTYSQEVGSFYNAIYLVEISKMVILPALMLTALSALISQKIVSEKTLQLAISLAFAAFIPNISDLKVQVFLSSIFFCSMAIVPQIHLSIFQLKNRKKKSAVPLYVSQETVA
ncbi:hypothetical protein PQO03_10120 [Lentisphaera profundi]|uniref:Uncharacterized protein n=1 Tax=Lentisphaera profundi TaxID=1658616 RepID=A0ABY7VS61_9BACT|nr:hypothetical protein [Lentisphaera profundi]WDE96068.1 hypothetical protein PQO03_10120 [Lentisphaera profundi]